jgi:hypothetical protein
MTLFFPDLNVWLALSVASHRHNAEASDWIGMLPKESQLIFSRYTQLGLLCLLTNLSVMGEQTLILRDAWAVYDHWLEDSRVEFYPEPSGLDAVFKEVTAPFAGQSAPMPHWSRSIKRCTILRASSTARLLSLVRAQGLHNIHAGGAGGWKHRRH